MPRAAAPSLTGQPELEPPVPEPSVPVQLLSEETPIQSQPEEAPAPYGASEASSPPPPPPAYAPTAPFPGMVTAAQVKQSPSAGPVIVEVILGLFGIFGVGWLAAGKTPIGLILLVLSAAWWVVSAFAAVHTVFVGCCGIIPLNLVFVAVSASMLHNAMRRS